MHIIPNTIFPASINSFAHKSPVDRHNNNICVTYVGGHHKKILSEKCVSLILNTHEIFPKFMICSRIILVSYSRWYYNYFKDVVYIYYRSGCVAKKMAQAIARDGRDVVNHKHTQYESEALAGINLKSSNCDEIQPGIWLGRINFIIFVYANILKYIIFFIQIQEM